MKVLIVTDVLGKANNGTTLACMNLIRYLQEQGDEVRVLCPDQDKKDWVNYYVVPNMHLGLLLDYIVNKLNNVTLARPNKKVIMKALDGVDIVHVILPLWLGIDTAKYARQKGIPVTAGFHFQAENLTAHIKLMNFKFANNLTYKTFYRKLYQYVDAIHYPTEFIKNVFENVIKKKTNAYVISNGVNDLYRKEEVKRTGELAKHYNILFIGRYSKEKSHPVLLKAIAKSKYKDNIQVIFAGQGPYNLKYKNIAKSLGILPPIMKFYTRKQLVEVINSCDLYVHPAEIEIEAISCLEAISCGLVPVISDSKRSATNAFALTENNLFKNNDSEDLARKIDYWIEHPKEKEECSKQYLGYTKRFDQDYCMKQMRDMLQTYAFRQESHTNKPKRYYRDELNDDFAKIGINVKHNKVGFKYVHKNWFFKGLSWFLYYWVARPIVWLANKLYYRQKIIGKEKLKEFKNKPYFIYANHVTGAGDAFTPNILTSKRNYILVSEDTTSIPGLKNLVQMLGAIPVPYHYENVRPFLDAIKYRTTHDKASITIYPEAHIWPGYTKIRNFKSVSFKYPVDLDIPCFVLTNTFQKQKGFKKPRLVTYVSGPFYPNKELNRKDAIEDLRNRVYEEMKKVSTSVEQVETIRYIKLDK